MQITLDDLLMEGEVTEQHIQKGERECFVKCPIALTLQEMIDNNPRLPNNLIVHIHETRANIYPGDIENTHGFINYQEQSLAEITATPAITQWIKNYDENRTANSMKIETKKEKSVGGDTRVYLYIGEN